MEIQYLWIEDFRSIKNQGFNFGSQYIFDFNSTTARLYYEINEAFIPDFFGSTTSNVTAFIGANGSGKSTILDFINLNMAVDIGNTNLSYLCIFKEKGREKLVIYNSTRKNILLPKDKEQIFQKATKGRIDGNLISLLYPTAFMFYSPAIDFNLDRQYIPIDLSITNLLANKKPGNFKDFNSIYYDLALEEMKKQMRFALKFKSVLPFLLPDELQMNPNYLEESHLIKNIKLDSELLRSLNKVKDDLKKELYERRGELDRPFIEIYNSLFWSTIHFLIDKNCSDELIPLLENSMREEKNTSWKLLQRLYENKSFNLPTWKKIKEFFQLLKELEKKEIMDYFFARFNFKIKPDGNFEKVNVFLDLYFELAVVGDFLRFNWSGLSTGEQSLFSMFSRFYDAQNQIIDYVKKINDYRVNIHNMSKFEEEPDVVIMIDEGEAHMHPQWQKELIYNLTKFLPTILNIPKIQLIVTSNSPFIISDLPHYNIVFLKSVNNLSIVDKSLVTSFAANIHDLLATSFFLDTPIGKLAENKINEVLTWLSEGQDKSQEKIDSIEKFIKIIDDPIVQEKLFQLLALKVRPDYWEEYTLELQKKLIDDKLKALRKKTI